MQEGAPITVHAGPVDQSNRDSRLECGTAHWYPFLFQAKLCGAKFQSSIFNIPIFNSRENEK